MVAGNRSGAGVKRFQAVGRRIPHKPPDRREVDAMLSQAGCYGQLTTPLGKDMLCLVELNASEGLSELFTFDVLAVSEKSDIELESLIGKGCSISVELADLGKRQYHGVAVHAHWERSEADLFYYRIELRPWLWMLGKTSDCRIFHDKTATDIISDTFKRHGFNDFRLSTTETYPTLHYTVQYRETDLNFVLRLMEQHGVYYFFEHSDDRHMLVLADGPSAHSPAPGLSIVKFNPHTHDRHQTREPSVDNWIFARRLRSGKVELNDYFHETPTTRLIADKQANENYTHSDFEVFDHPGPHTKQNDGEFYAKVELQAEQCADKRRQARGVAVALYPGASVHLQEHPRAAENEEYLTVRVMSRVGPQYYRGERGRGGDLGYAAAYEFQLLETPFRAPLVTPKPLIHSLQTAYVVGAKGEEIDCDDHGRILVHFHWDRHDDQSCRIRVGQVWAGQSWGGQTIPRIGMEVVVAFIDGDPDRPLVVGAVPNPKTLPVPDKLPDYKTRMVLKSKTHKGDGYNELRFEDEKSEEEIWLHAQKYLNAQVLDNETWEVKNNRHKRVDSNQSESVGGDKDIEVKGKHREHVVKSYSLKVDDARKTKIARDDSLEVGVNRNEKIGAQLTCDVGQAVYIKAGQTVVIEAGMQLSLKVGGNFIDISPAGIAIYGTMVLINSGGAPGVLPLNPPDPPEDYGGPAAKRYDRSYKL
jgi:type VI secretion system secreted protein VgrG